MEIMSVSEGSKIKNINCQKTVITIDYLAARSKHRSLWKCGIHFAIGQICPLWSPPLCLKMTCFSGLEHRFQRSCGVIRTLFLLVFAKVHDYRISCFKTAHSFKANNSKPTLTPYLSHKQHSLEMALSFETANQRTLKGSHHENHFRLQKRKSMSDPSFSSSSVK